MESRFNVEHCLFACLYLLVFWLVLGWFDLIWSVWCLGLILVVCVCACIV